MTKRTVTSAGFFSTSTVARIGALATSVALAFGAITATAGTAQAIPVTNIGGGCMGVVNGKVVRVNCDTGKPISDKQWLRQLNNGYDLYDAKQSDNAVFEVPLPKRMRGETVTVTATYAGGGTEWLFDLTGDWDAPLVRSATVKVKGTGITVAIPNTDFDSCYGISVIVKAKSVKKYKYYIAGHGISWNYGPNPDNGYRDLTIKP